MRYSTYQPSQDIRQRVYDALARRNLLTWSRIAQRTRLRPVISAFTVRNLADRDRVATEPPYLATLVRLARWLDLPVAAFDPTADQSLTPAHRAVRDYLVDNGLSMLTVQHQLHLSNPTVLALLHGDPVSARTERYALAAVAQLRAGRDGAPYEDGAIPPRATSVHSGPPSTDQWQIDYFRDAYRGMFQVGAALQAASARANNLFFLADYVQSLYTIAVTMEDWVPNVPATQRPVYARLLQTYAWIDRHPEQPLSQYTHAAEQTQLPRDRRGDPLYGRPWMLYTCLQQYASFYRGEEHRP